MSKATRNKQLKIIDLLVELSNMISKCMQEDRLQECLTLLIDCQDSAITLGTHLEKLHGFFTKTVKALEQYCEASYQLSTALVENAQIDMAEQNLKSSIELVKGTFVEEFPERKEVVFLPYNASMWDSLESVWMAARDDEECEVYVIPIPYYEYDKDKNAKELHYEGDKFPDYVPITHYSEYDLELHHPDMIFIHNPYDDCNVITTVDPEYYSAKIKDYTDKLVYIPYFILPEVEIDDEVSIEKIKQFCYVPGTIHADKVIVQSENIRQIYINEYLKAAAENGERITREELEERILGLGSPKLDKVGNTKKDEVEIPDEWAKLIQKSDGGRKKIILYNTSVQAFLNDSEKMLTKIKSALGIFKENKDEVALLWRPHPLMKQTISVAHPELWVQYQAIVQDYRDAAWGIYDDTSDLDRAIIISDAYYGDYSSLVQLYQETKKPIMIQNVDMI